MRLPVRAFAAACVVATSAVIATVLLWPHGVIEPSVVDLAAYFKSSEIKRWDHFRGPQRLLGLGASLAWLIGVAIVLWRTGQSRLPSTAPRAALTGALATLVGFVLSLPVAWIATGRAQREGLVTQSQAQWLADSALGAGLIALISAALLAALFQLMSKLPRYWWAGAAIFVVAGSCLLTLASPVVIEPLFADFREPRDGTLEREARVLASRAGISPEKLLVVDASNRTAGANAYVSGWGPTERIVFYDTLLERFTPAEARGVLAHELAHAKHNDVPRGLLWLALFAFPAAWAVSLVVRPGNDHREAGRALSDVALALLAVAAFGSIAAGPMSRQVEARADTTALQLTADPDAARKLTVRLARQNLGDPDPPALYHSLMGTHPTIRQRLGSIETYERVRRREGR